MYARLLTSAKIERFALLNPGRAGRKLVEATVKQERPRLLSDEDSETLRRSILGEMAPFDSRRLLRKFRIKKKQLLKRKSSQRIRLLEQPPEDFDAFATWMSGRMNRLDAPTTNLHRKMQSGGW